MTAQTFYEPLRAELMLRGIEDAEVIDSGGGVMILTGTLPNGWTVDVHGAPQEQAFAFSDADGTSMVDAAFSDGRCTDPACTAQHAPDYDALAVDDADEGAPYSGRINEDSAAFAALTIWNAYEAVQ